MKREIQASSFGKEKNSSSHPPPISERLDLDQLALGLEDLVVAGPDGLFRAMHTFDFPPLASRPWLRTSLIGGLCLCGLPQRTCRAMQQPGLVALLSEPVVETGSEIVQLRAK